MTATLIESLKQQQAEAADRYRQLAHACLDETQPVDGTEANAILAQAGKTLDDLQADVTALREITELEARIADAQKQFDELREQLERQGEEVTRLRELAQRSAIEHEHARQQYIGINAGRYSSGQKLTQLRNTLRDLKGTLFTHQHPQ
jgi:hypothetical protein